MKGKVIFNDGTEAEIEVSASLAEDNLPVEANVDTFVILRLEGITFDGFLDKVGRQVEG